MPGACSLVAKEAEMALGLVKVDGNTKKTENDQDFLTGRSEAGSGPGWMPRAYEKARYRVQQGVGVHLLAVA